MFNMNPLNPGQTFQDVKNMGERSLQQFQKDFNALFQRYFGETQGMPVPNPMSAFDSSNFWDFRVEEKENEIVVRAEIPGFEREDISIELQNNELTINAQRVQECGGQQNLRKFNRSVQVPNNVQEDQIQANYRNGILEIRIPRSEPAKGKKIPIME